MINQPKNTASVTNKTRGGGDVTWDSSDPATWDESSGSWDFFASMKNQAKNVATITNQVKN